MKRDLVAAAVLFHAVAVVALSIPAPPPGMRGDRADPATEASLRAWGDAAAAVGVPRSVFEPVVWEVTRAQQALVGTIRAVFGPYARLVGAGQGWTMFGSVPERVARLEIEVHTGRGWEPLYVARSDQAAWRRDLLDQERMRTLVHLFARRQGRTRYEAFADWIATRIAEDRPDADRVRVQLRRVAIPPPEVLAETGVLALGSPFWVEVRPVPTDASARPTDGSTGKTSGPTR